MAVSGKTTFEPSDEEIDVVGIEPNDDKIVSFDSLPRDLSADYGEASYYHTNADSHTEDVMIDVINTSTITAEINDKEHNFSTLQDESISLGETVNSYEGRPSKVQKQSTFSTSTKISPTKSAESKQRLECPTCHGIYKTKRSLRVHMQTCNKSPHLFCCFCSYASKQTANIKRHLKRIHTEKFVTIDELEDACQNIYRNGKVMLENGMILTSTNEPLNTFPTQRTESHKPTQYGVSSLASNYCPKCGKIVKATGQCLMCKSIALFQCNKYGQQYSAHCSVQRANSELRNHTVHAHMPMQNGIEALPPTGIIQHK